MWRARPFTYVPSGQPRPCFLAALGSYFQWPCSALCKLFPLLVRGRWTEIRVAYMWRHSCKAVERAGRSNDSIAVSITTWVHCLLLKGRDSSRRNNKLGTVPGLSPMNKLYVRCQDIETRNHTAKKKMLVSKVTRTRYM
jgi:hypothetical protein